MQDLYSNKHCTQCSKNYIIQKYETETWLNIMKVHNSLHVTGSSRSDNLRARECVFNDFVFFGLGMDESAGVSSV